MLFSYHIGHWNDFFENDLRAILKTIFFFNISYHQSLLFEKKKKIYFWHNFFFLFLTLWLNSLCFLTSFVTAAFCAKLLNFSSVSTGHLNLDELLVPPVGRVSSFFRRGVFPCNCLLPRDGICWFSVAEFSSFSTSSFLKEKERKTELWLDFFCWFLGGLASLLKKKKVSTDL